MLDDASRTAFLNRFSVFLVSFAANFASRRVMHARFGKRIFGGGHASLAIAYRRPSWDTHTRFGRRTLGAGQRSLAWANLIVARTQADGQWLEWRCEAVRRAGLRIVADAGAWM